MLSIRKPLIVFAIPLLVLASGSSVSARSPVTAGADDLRGIVDGIVAAWDSADLVCLGEGHGDRNDADLRLALVRHPEFVRRVHVIVVEFGDRAQQSLLDRLVLEGESIARSELRAVWGTARGAEVWESPVYEGFLRAVADVNKRLPREQRVRVVAGDDPSVQNRGRAIRELISREILDKGTKGLAVFGARHCERRGFGFPGELSARYPGRIWAVLGFYDVTAGRRALNLGVSPQLIPVSGTERARVPVGRMFFVGRAHDTATLGDVADALVYYGDRTPSSVDR